MKVYQIIFIILFISILIAVMTGCEYKGPTPTYFQEYDKTTPPVITQMIPDKEAAGGVNYITIIGKNFSDIPANNKVYIDGLPAEMVSSSPTSITIRRPNVFGDSMIIKVVNFDAHDIAQSEPYKIVPVFSTFGNFMDGGELTAVAVDNEENIYVAQINRRSIYKVTPAGEKILVGTYSLVVYDLKFAPTGHLLLLKRDKKILRMNVETGATETWLSLTARVNYGDFDNHGNFYAGGNNSDLFVISHQDLSSRQIGVYAEDNILRVHVKDNYVYLLVDFTNPDENNIDLAIWKHEIRMMPEHWVRDNWYSIGLKLANSLHHK